MAGGNVGEGVIVDLTRCRRGWRSAPATARGTRRQHHPRGAQQCRRSHGLRLPPDPSSGRWATLGGMLSTNAAGARSVRYGSVRRWVRAAEMVTADGEIVSLRRGAGGDRRGDSARSSGTPPRRSMPRPRRSAAASRYPQELSGYALDAWLASGDLLDLVVGAEGTLGIVTRRNGARPGTRSPRGPPMGLRSLDDLSASWPRSSPTSPPRSSSSTAPSSIWCEAPIPAPAWTTPRRCCWWSSSGTTRCAQDRA